MNKIIVNRDLLVSRLDKAVKFIPDPAIIPQFNNFRLSIQGGMMEIIACDSERQIRLFCPVESKTDWSFCVPGRLLLATIKLYREAEITITEKSPTKVELKAGKSKYNITLDCLPENFQPMKIEDIHSEITMHQIMLNMGLKNAKDFVDPKHPNSNFTMVNMAEIGNKIIFTGATQVQICRAAIRPISINKWTTGVSFNTDTAKIICGLLSDKGEINIAHSNTKIKFMIFGEWEDIVEVISVVHNGKYPGTESLYKDISEQYITVNTTELSDAIKRLRLYTPEGEKAKIHMHNIDNSQEFNVSSVDENTGKSGEEIIAITNPSGAKFDKKLLNEAVLNVLNHTEAAEVNIHFSPEVGQWHIIPKVQSAEEDIFKFMLSMIV